MRLQFTQKKISFLQEAFCISVAMCIGILIYKGFKIYNGYWIPMTTGIMFLAACQGGQGAIVKKIHNRIIGTFIGALLGFLYVDIFMYSNYHWAYLLPFVWFLGWYLYLLTGNYIFIPIMITMFVPMIIGITTESPISIGDTLIKRIACTILGVSIALIAEFVIYRNAASSKPVMKQNTDNLFRTHCDIIRLATGYYLDDLYKAGMIDDEFSKTMWKSLSNIASIENLYLCIKYEFDYKIDHGKFYQCLLKHTSDINRLTKKFINLMIHDKYDGSVLSTKEINELSVKVSEKYKNMLQYFDGKTDNTSDEILRILSNINSKDRFNPTYLFIKSLHEFSRLADELSNVVYNSKY